jgi:ubiquinone/menaquinone biosynthesis C-methylase UbiE
MWFDKKSIESKLREFFNFEHLPFSKGIPDLLHSDSHTLLDHMDYDAVYDININRALTDFKIISGQVAPLFERHFPAVLELGAGTGMFTLAFAEKASFDKYLVTDVSIQMLSQLKKKLEARVKAGAISKEVMQKITLVGIDCEHFGSKKEVFDLVSARSVLHHILHYERLFSELVSSLKSSGIVYFMEPNLAYNAFLVHLLGLILDSKAITDKYAASPDYLTLQAWRASIFMRVKYRKEIKYLQDLEDKHIFQKDELTAKLNKAGFENVEFIPGYPNTRFSYRLGCTMQELQLSSEEFKRDILCVLKYYDSDLERLLIKDALNPAYHIIASNQPLLIRSKEQKPREVMSEDELFAALKLKIAFDSFSTELISGWAVATKEIYQIRVRQAEKGLILLMNIPRPDVKQGFHGGDYADEIALFSGFAVKNNITLDLSQATLLFEFRDGSQFEVPYTKLSAGN